MKLAIHAGSIGGLIGVTISIFAYFTVFGFKDTDTFTPAIFLITGVGLGTLLSMSLLKIITKSKKKH